MAEQLELFAAKILPFPTRRRVDEVRRVAAILHAIDDEDDERADTAWNAEIDAIEGTLVRLGAPEAEIEAHVLGFRHAVYVELVRLMQTRESEPQVG